MNVSHQEFIEILRTEPIVTVSDGASKDSKGTYAFIIGDSETYYVKGSGYVSGHNPSSFRSEGFGILAGMRFLFHFIK